MLKDMRKRNPSLFDLVLFIAFTVLAFASYLLAEVAGTLGALVALTLLAVTCVVMSLSR